MKNISHIINNAPIKLLIAALVLATASPFSLDAMKRKLDESNDKIEQGPAKKRKIEKFYTIKCDDGTIFQEVLYEVLLQSVTIKVIIDDEGFIPTEAIPMPEFISGSTMEIMIDYMGLVAILKYEKVSDQDIIIYLTTTILALHTNQTLDEYKTYLETAQYLDFKLLRAAFEHLKNLCLDDISPTPKPSDDPIEYVITIK